jgi:hypothetical protein
MEGIDAAVRHALEVWAALQADPARETYYLGTVALDVASFYTGLERIFYRIARIVDRYVPTGNQWHRALLEQMTYEVPGVRPAVLRRETSVLLDAYLGLRHRIRGMYVFEIVRSKLEPLIIGLSSVHAEVRRDIEAFLDFLGEVLRTAGG